MGLLEELHEERKARLLRIEQAAIRPAPSPILPPEPLNVRDNLPFNNFDIIMNEICAYYGDRVEDILSSRRQANLSQHRSILAYMVYLLTPLSNPQIATKMNRDPTSIGYAINKIKNNILLHRPIIEELEAKIRPLLVERGRRVKDKL